MKFLTILLLIFVNIHKYSTQTPQLDADENVILENGYRFRFKTDTIERSEFGNYDPTESDDVQLKVIGSYSFIASDGKLYRINYVADENGYQPKFSTGETPTSAGQAQPGQVYQAPAALLASLGGNGLG